MGKKEGVRGGREGKASAWLGASLGGRELINWQERPWNIISEDIASLGKNLLSENLFPPGSMRHQVLVTGH